jgi:hypothetical protein
MLYPFMSHVAVVTLRVSIRTNYDCGDDDLKNQIWMLLFILLLQVAIQHYLKYCNYTVLQVIHSVAAVAVLYC